MVLGEEAGGLTRDCPCSGPSSVRLILGWPERSRADQRRDPGPRPVGDPCTAVCVSDPERGPAVGWPGSRSQIGEIVVSEIGRRRPSAGSAVADREIARREIGRSSGDPGPCDLADRPAMWRDVLRFRCRLRHRSRPVRSRTVGAGRSEKAMARRLAFRSQIGRSPGIGPARSADRPDRRREIGEISQDRRIFCSGFLEPANADLSGSRASTHLGSRFP